MKNTETLKLTNLNNKELRETNGGGLIVLAYLGALVAGVIVGISLKKRDR